MTKRFFGASILTLAVMCAALTGCPDVTPDGDGGAGGGGTGELATHTGVAGAGGSGGSDAGPAVCFLNSDCPMSTVACKTIRCDPTGHKTDPGLMLGCYSMPDYDGAPCTTDGGTGTCHTINGEPICIKG